jgi:hypothetical protein
MVSIPEFYRCRVLDANFQVTTHASGGCLYVSYSEESETRERRQSRNKYHFGLGVVALVVWLVFFGLYVWSVVMRYLESQDDCSASESELEAALKWARTAMTEAILLEGVLAGKISLSAKQGGMNFQLVSQAE